VGTLDFHGVGLRIGTRRMCRVVEEGLYLLDEVNALIIEMNASAKSVLSFEAPSAMSFCQT
jgi:hypothetical protein